MIQHSILENEKMSRKRNHFLYSKFTASLLFSNIIAKVYKTNSVIGATREKQKGPRHTDNIKEKLIRSKVTKKTVSLDTKSEKNELRFLLAKFWRQFLLDTLIRNQKIPENLYA